MNSPSTSSSQPRIAVAGVGHLGAIHTKLWRTQPEATLVGVFDNDSERAAAVAREHGVERVFSSFDELLASVDALCIVTPTSTHYELARRALAAGKHCFIEKPITTTHNEALELARMAEERGCVIHVGHVERFNPALQAVRERFHLREHGAEALQASFAPLFIESHRLAQFKPRATDVSVILDLMIHDIDIALWLVRSPVAQIDANGVAILTDTPDIANARIRFASGCVANLTASRITQKPMRKTRVFQRDAYISMDFASGDVEIFRLVDEINMAAEEAATQASEGIPALMLGNIEAGTQKRSIFFEKPTAASVNAIAEEQVLFVQAIQRGDAAATPPATTASEAAEALRVAEEIARQIAAASIK
jgi:predicted dehydrogenase